MSSLLFVVVIFILLHGLVAIAGTIIVSALPQRLYPRKFLVIFLCWICPFFGILLLIRAGKYVPEFGANSYQSACHEASLEYETEAVERELDKSIRYRDSGYGGQSGGFDGGDGGGD